MTLDLKFVRSGGLARLDTTYEFDKKTNQASELKISFNLINWKAVLLLAFVWTGFYWMVPDYWSQCDIWVEIRKRSCWCISPQCCMTPIWTLTSFIPLFLFLSLLYSPSCILVCSPPASKVSYVRKDEDYKAIISNQILLGFPVMESCGLVGVHLSWFLALHHLPGGIKYIYFVIFVFGYCMGQWWLSGQRVWVTEIMSYVLLYIYVTNIFLLFFFFAILARGTLLVQLRWCF